jgi:hypothetical protein
MEGQDVNKSGNRETKKGLLKTWQILFMVLGSFIVTLPFFSIFFDMPQITAFLPNAAAILKRCLPFSLLLLPIITPVLFMFTLVVKKPKLRIIPYSFFLAVLIFIFMLEGEEGIFLAFIVGGFYGGLTLFGMTSGFLLRLLRDEGCKLKRLKAVSGIIILLIPMLIELNWVAVNYLGNPIGTYFAKRKTEAYVNEYYDKYNYQIGDTKYTPGLSGYSSYYVTEVTSKTYTGIDMKIRISRGKIYDDSGEALGSIVSRLFWEAFGSGYKKIEFMDKGASPAVLGHVRIELTAENFDAYTLSEIITKCRNVAKANDFHFRQYDFLFRIHDNDKEVHISGIKPDHINDGLQEMVEQLLMEYR